MRTDFENLQDGQRVRLFPRPNNSLHKAPTVLTFDGRDFWSDDPKQVAKGPDYYLGDVLTFCEGFEIAEEKK